MLIGSALWRSRFAADPRILGAMLRLDGVPYEVVSVLPSSFQFPERSTELWLPLALDSATPNAGGFNEVVAIGRLRPGVALTAAQAELQRLFVRLPESYPAVYPGLPMASFLAESRAAQVALAFVLLAASGLLVRTVYHLRAVDLGFDPTNTLTLSLLLPTTDFPRSTNVSAFYDRLAERVHALPGVEDAGVVSKLPLEGHAGLGPVYVEQLPVSRNTLPPLAAIDVASAGYFRAMRIPVITSRLFGSPSQEQTMHEVLVSRAVGLAIFAAVGRVLRAMLFDVNPDDPLTLLAVCGILLLTAALAVWLPVRHAASIDPLEALRAE